jgi:hypothetical protein
MGLVKDKDVLSVTRLEEVEGDKEVDLEEGWDTINLNALAD